MTPLHLVMFDRNINVDDAAKNVEKAHKSYFDSYKFAANVHLLQKKVSDCQQLEAGLDTAQSEYEVCRLDSANKLLNYESAKAAQRNLQMEPDVSAVKLQGAKLKFEQAATELKVALNREEAAKDAAPRLRIPGQS